MTKRAPKKYNQFPFFDTPSSCTQRQQLSLKCWILSNVQLILRLLLEFPEPLRVRFQSIDVLILFVSLDPPRHPPRHPLLKSKSAATIILFSYVGSKLLHSLFWLG